jgi:large subunit ribosomal protein L25
MGVAPVCLSLKVRDFEKLIKDHSVVQHPVNLVIETDESKGRTILIKNMDIDPVTHSVLHVDFYQFSSDRKIKTKVPVVTKGKAIGVEMGGILQIISRELEVLCLPMEIPEAIEIDVSELKVGDSIHVKDLQLPGNVELPVGTNFTVVSVLGARRDAGAEAEEAEAEAGEEGGGGESEE